MNVRTEVARCARTNMGESWMLARLRRETAVCHHTADEDRLAVMKETISPGHYLSFLMRVYGFESPVVAALAITDNLENWIDLRGHVQVRLLRADLMALGVVDPLDLPRCAGIAPFSSAAIALGWLYVLERNTLMHGLIERHLRARLPDLLRIAGSYLAASDRAGGARWRELGEAMDRCGRNPRDADQIVDAVRAASRCQHRWYEATPFRRVA